MRGYDIELSKSGIKFSYHRFLADSSAGIVIVVLFILSYYLPVFGKPIYKNFVLGMSSQVEIFLSLLFFILSTPIGLSINSLSWASIGNLIICIENKFLFNCDCFIDFFITKSTKRTHQFEKCKRMFNLSKNKNNWYRFSSYITKVSEVYFPELVDTHRYIEGIGIFFRNITLLSWLFIPFFLYFNWVPSKTITVISITIFIISIISLILSAVVNFYQHIIILSRAAILCEVGGLQESQSADMKKIAEFVVETYNSLRHVSKHHLELESYTKNSWIVD